MRPGPIHRYLADDHDRLGTLLDRALGQADDIETDSYEAFRSGLLRHIGLEEKLLFPSARRMGDARILEMVDRLHREHAVFAAMLVPKPTAKVLGQMRDLLAHHNAREESTGGLYEVAELIAGENSDALAAELRAGPMARVAPHFDTELAHENIRVLLRALESR